MEKNYEGLYVAIDLLDKAQSFDLSLNGEKLLAFALAGDDAYLQSVVEAYYGPRGEVIPQDVIEAREQALNCPCGRHCCEPEDGQQELGAEPEPEVSEREAQPQQEFNVRQMTPEQAAKLRQETTELLRQFFPWM